MRNRIGLVLHGSESIDLGGPSVRVPLTVKKLMSMGQDAVSINFPAEAMKLQSCNVVHVYNIWTHKSCLETLQFCRMMNLKIVLSPILLDFNEDYNSTAFEEGDSKIFNPVQTEYDLDALSTAFELADHVVYLSRAEQAQAKRLCLPMRPCSIINNPVDTSLFLPGTGNIFQRYFKQVTGIALPDRFALNVGRIEPRKNQLTLIRSLATKQYPLVFIGGGTNLAYMQACRAAAGPEVHFLGNIGREKEILASSYQAAAVYAHIAWSEGASLSVLEAAATGCRLVLSDLPAMIEYFGPMANYVSPSDEIMIRKMVTKKLDGGDMQTSSLVRMHTTTAYNYDLHCAQLIDIYRGLGSTKR